MCKVVGDSLQQVEYIVVPVAEVASLETQGWEIYRAWTDGTWKPGDLIGKDGSDPATKAQSASYATPDRWDQVSDCRSATSTGHVPQHDRPPDVGLGWGGYDQFTHWQACGRLIPKDKVKREEWSTDRMAPVDFVNESGEAVETVQPAVEAHNLPPRPIPPLPLYELLHGRVGRPNKAPTTERTSLAWPGTREGEY
ncbi:hypothetical protein BGZ63DRAFT_362140 [Mariannaea sp. PMI_226]|nr:hypothetical protein BGZ63DRAFT_362140 [Mariannaea sp. PMI_226]